MNFTLYITPFFAIGSVWLIFFGVLWGITHSLKMGRAI